MNQEKRSTRAWLIGALAFSLAVNLLLVGFYLGSEHRLRGAPGFAPPHSQIGRFARSLDESRRAELAPLLKAHRRTGRTSMMALGRARRALNEAISADPLDLAAVEAAMAEVDKALLSSSRHSQQAMLPLIRVLEPDERAAFAASGRRLRNRPPRPHHTR